MNKVSGDRSVDIMAVDIRSNNKRVSLKKKMTIVKLDEFASGFSLSLPFALCPGESKINMNDTRTQSQVRNKTKRNA